LKLELSAANVVVIAQSHNPTIPSKEWLLANGIISPPVVNFTHVPVFSLVETEQVILVVDESRLQVSSKKLDEEGLAYVMQAVARYVRHLPETPYTAVGLNFHWSAVAEDEHKVSELARRAFVGDRDRLIRALSTDKDLRVGSILYVGRHGFLLKVVIEPVIKEPAKLVIALNYHRDVAGADEACKAFEDSGVCLNDSSSIVRALTEE